MNFDQQAAKERKEITEGRNMEANGSSRKSYASNMVNEEFVKGNILKKGKFIYRNNLHYSVCASFCFAFIFSILMRLNINDLFGDYSYQMGYLSRTAEILSPSSYLFKEMAKLELFYADKIDDSSVT